jgi:hypothetical protein
MSYPNATIHRMYLQAYMHARSGAPLSDAFSDFDVSESPREFSERIAAYAVGADEGKIGNGPRGIADVVGLVECLIGREDGAEGDGKKPIGFEP